MVMDIVISGVLFSWLWELVHWARESNLAIENLISGKPYPYDIELASLVSAYPNHLGKH